MRDYSINKKFDSYKEQFLDDLFSLMRIPSVLESYDKNNESEPFGKNIKDCLCEMFRIAKRDGFDVYDKSSYYGFVDFGCGEKLVLVLCHLDVVPVAGEWKYGPFNPTIEDGYVVGRGSSDDKGPLMSFYYALRMLKDSGYTPNMKIRFIFGCDEESGSRCLERYIEDFGSRCDYGFSPDADYPLIYAEKGICGIKFSLVEENDLIESFNSGIAANVVPDYATATLKKGVGSADSFNAKSKAKITINGFEVTSSGVSCHGSEPSHGVNAAEGLAMFLKENTNSRFLDFYKDYLADDYIGERFGVALTDSEMGRCSNNIGIVKYENNTWTAISNFRYPKGFDYDKSMAKIIDCASKYGVKAELTGNSPYHYVAKDSELVKALMKAYDAYVSDGAQPFSIGGGTYAREFENAVAFGCQFLDRPNTMHMIDEKASIDDLILSVFIYKDAILNICDLEK